MRIRKLWSAAWVLLFLSPIVGELLSGSAPPAEFFNPLGFVMLTVLYGGGAILARELTHRWGKGWPTLLILGAAYGIAEEGLMCKSFFDPNWVDLGVLGSYGRWLGVNWVWSLELTIYHTVFSICIPILLVNIMFPSWHTRAWISRRKLVGLFILWVLNAVVIFLAITAYRPPIAQYIGTLALTIGLVILAWRLPYKMFESKASQKSVSHPIWFLITGFLASVLFFLGVWLLPGTGIHPVLTMFFIIAVAALAGWLVLKMSGGGLAWSNKHQLALASGVLGFFIIIAPLQELDKNRSDNTTGMTIVGFAMAIFLLWMFWRMRHNGKNETTADFSSPVTGE